jgi:nucleotide-binding universal stress UspA family protein
MYKHLLVAVDLSQISQAVFNHALELAQLSGGDILLVYVLAPETANMPFSYAPLVITYTPIMVEEFQKEWETFRQFCEQKLASFVRQAETAGVKIKAQQLSGHAGISICETAQKEGIDTIIIGRRGHSNLNEILLGSTSNYVLHHAPCLVMVVQPSA